MATALGSRAGRKARPCSICKKSHAPWWNSEKGAWYLCLPKIGEPGKYRKISLGDDHDKALERWHRIEAGLESDGSTSGPTTTNDGILVGELVNLFLDSPASAPSPERYKITKNFLREFARGFGGLPVSALRVGGVNKIEKWIAAHKNWNGCIPDVVCRIRRLFNWATDEGYIPGSPVRSLKKPRYNIRVSWFTAEQEAAILSVANSHFAAGFRMLILTGARPDEICSLTSDNVHEDRKNGLYLLVDHKTQKKTSKQRKIYLKTEAQELLREQMKKFPSGRLFRSNNKTTDGNRPPLSPEYFAHALREITKKPECKKLGLDDYEIVGRTKLGKPKKQYKYVAYTTRHTFAQRHLTGVYRDAKGEPIIMSFEVVAAYLGNTARMVEEIYGHLCDQADFLQARLDGKPV